MRSLMPVMIAAPSFVQGSLAISARGRSDAAFRRCMKAGLAFNVCYLIVVCIVFAVLYVE